MAKDKEGSVLANIKARLARVFPTAQNREKARRIADRHDQLKAQELALFWARVEARAKGYY